MSGADVIAMAFANLGRRKGRTGLTAAGVVVGVASLVLMVSLGLGLQRQVVQLFESDEAMRTITIRRTKGEGGKKKAASPFPFAFDGQMMPITDKDLEELRGVPGVALVRPELNMFLRVELEGRERSEVYPVDGVPTEDFPRFEKHLVAGKGFASGDEKAVLLPLALLEMRLEMKPEDVIGKKVTFSALMQEETPGAENDAYVVAGVIDTETFGLRGRQVFVPMERALGLREKKSAHPLLPSKRGSYLSAELRLEDSRRMDEVSRRLRSLGYSVLSAVEILKNINLVFLVLEGFMACVGAIGLVVSLFGIANTMAMAVLERTREIGIMKALGARNRDIGRLFLSEAAAIGALGGVVGLAAGTALGKLLNLIAHLAFDLPERVALFHVTVALAGGSVLFSILVSVAAGWLPSRRAARMEPVAAVRYE